MLLEAILIALWAGIIGIDMYVGLTHIHRPVVTGLVVGLILGDVMTGLMVGGTLELIWMGMVPLAGAQPPNVVIGGTIGTAFGIIAGHDPEVAIGVAIPFAVAVQALITLLFTALAPAMHKADQFALVASLSGIVWFDYLGVEIELMLKAVIAVLPIWYGAEEAGAAVVVVPEGIVDGVSIAGGFMVAIGFAMVFRVLMKV